MRRLLLTLGVLLCAASASAQVAIDAVTSAGVTGTTNTISHTVSGSDRAMVVACHVLNGATVVTVTYAGVTLSLAQIELQAEENLDVELWTLVAPTTGTNNAVITISGPEAQYCTVLSFTGVNQSAPFGADVGDQYAASGTAHSHSTTSETNGLVVDAITFQASAGTVTTDAGQTNRAGPAQFNTDFIYAVSTEPGAASVTTGYSWTNDFNRWAHATIPIAPVGGGGGGAGKNGMLLGVGP